MSNVGIYSTLNDGKIEERLILLLPSGIEVTKEIEGCEAAIIAARSISAGAGVKNAREHLDKATELKIPCLVLGRETALISYAKDRGIPEENIINAHKISLKYIAEKLKDIICANDYIIVDDDNEEGEDYIIDDEFCPNSPTHQIKPIPDSCVFMGVKGGVGVSTVVSMVASTLDNSYHIEITGKNRPPSAYCYYGSAPSKTSESYILWATDEAAPVIKGTALIDLSQSAPIETADTLTGSAACVVLVADRSEISFNLTGQMLRAGIKPDILVINAVLPGIGNGAEVYRGEYKEMLHDIPTFELPASLDEEKLIMYAQRNGIPPCNTHKSAAADMFAGELTSAIRNVLGV